MYRLTIRIRSDDTNRPNTNTLFGPLFGTEANTKRIFGTSLISTGLNSATFSLRQLSLYAGLLLDHGDYCHMTHMSWYFLMRDILYHSVRLLVRRS